ncbi:hypothetical protein Aple_067740 [Acrocarpospora pleiomorpha]|uniref:Uncharacterized protein n=1 Tax=Acrocarpospora pleiomorpha TaxID=90975 RepID=A0A5M3XRC5_9ACTN|nr:hypothetical protein Aple_067740 [Acrocarpospora pleiomorpha]
MFNPDSRTVIVADPVAGPDGGNVGRVLARVMRLTRGDRLVATLGPIVRGGDNLAALIVEDRKLLDEVQSRSAESTSSARAKPPRSATGPERTSTERHPHPTTRVPNSRRPNWPLDLDVCPPALL